MDWIDEFLSETEGLSPYPFRLWAGISAIASILERRVFMTSDRGPLWPNLYVTLTGASGSGKSLMVNQVRELWKGIPGLHVGPDNPTTSSFMQAIANAREVYFNGTGEPHTQSAVTFGIREFGVMIPKNDLHFLSAITDLWDNPSSYEAPRTSVEGYKMECPTVNFLAGVTAAYLYEIFPEAAWQQGFCSRLFFIFSEPQTKGKSIFDKRKPLAKTRINKFLEEVYNDIKGEFEWTDDAADAADQWCRQEDMKPVPTHDRLRSYCERRESYILKLAMISAISAGHELTVELFDYERAKRWLLDAEVLMPDVFRSMIQRSDSQLIRELHNYLWNIYSTLERGKRKPVNQVEAWKFLRERVPSERIGRVIETAIQSGVLRKGEFPDELVPETLDKFTLL